MEIQKLQSLAARLNQATDSLNDSLLQIEQTLNSLNIGIEVWLYGFPLDTWGKTVEKKNYSDRYSYWQDILGYAKLDDKWGLVVKTVKVVETLEDESNDIPFYIEYLEEQNFRLLLKASRELRVNAASKIPELLSLVKNSAQEALEGIEKAKEAAEQLK